ncbi:MAG: class I SAM-dependent methyltransferase [Magnetococcales bacterium]|nr:class I SAM-dependent methyltransferase [Magnetococcales bacterium]
MNRAEFNQCIQGAYQNSDELYELVQRHLLPLKPKTIIEIGVRLGGSTRLFLDLVGPDGTVIGLDLEWEPIATDVLNDKRFKLVLGDSGSEEIRDRVAELSGPCDLLLIDGDHSQEGVLRDTELYLPLVRPGGLVLWHDIRLEHPEGVRESWYSTLRPNLLAAQSLFLDPFNTGFGLWYKTDRQRKDLLTDAWKAIATQRFVDAKQLLRELLSHDPCDGDALLAMAELLYKTGNGEPATLFWLKAIACDEEPDSLSPDHLPLGRVLEPALSDQMRQVYTLLTQESLSAEEWLHQVLWMLEHGLGRQAANGLEKVPDTQRSSALYLEACWRSLTSRDEVPQHVIVDTALDLLEALISSGKSSEKLIDHLLTEELPQRLFGLIRLHRAGDALERIERTLDLAPTFSMHAQELLAEGFAVQGRYCQFEDAFINWVRPFTGLFLRAWEAGPNTPDTAHRIIRSLVNARLTEEVEHFLAELKQPTPPYPPLVVDELLNRFVRGAPHISNNEVESLEYRYLLSKIVQESAQSSPLTEHLARATESSSHRDPCSDPAVTSDALTRFGSVVIATTGTGDKILENPDAIPSYLEENWQQIHLNQCAELILGEAIRIIQWPNSEELRHRWHQSVRVINDTRRYVRGIVAIRKTTIRILAIGCSTLWPTNTSEEGLQPQLSPDAEAVSITLKPGEVLLCDKFTPLQLNAPEDSYCDLRFQSTTLWD